MGHSARRRHRIGARAMQDEPHAQRMTGEPAGRAAAEARATPVVERAKTRRIAQTPQSPRAAPRRTSAWPPNFLTLDRLSRALLARATQGISPDAVAETWADWALHLARAQGKRLELAQLAAMMMARFALWLPSAAALARRDAPVEPAPATADFPIPPGRNGRSTSSRKASSRPRPGGGRRQAAFPGSRAPARPKPPSWRARSSILFRRATSPG